MYRSARGFALDTFWLQSCRHCVFCCLSIILVMFLSLWATIDRDTSHAAEEDVSCVQAHYLFGDTPYFTHNLEVPGSSPGWSTLKISNLEEVQVADFSFCENNAKTIGLSSTPFSTTFCNFLPYLFSRKLGPTQSRILIIVA